MTTPDSHHAYQLSAGILPHPPSTRPLTTTAEWQDGSADRAGQVLYERRAACLPGLGQPAAPAWRELEESVRGRWRAYAGNVLVNGAGR
jgi:hypothetical protein